MENTHISAVPPLPPQSEPHSAPAMSPEQLHADMNTIRSVLSSGSADQGPHRVIIAGSNIFCGFILVIAIPFILLGFLMVLASPFFLAGWGLLKNRSWGATAAVVAAVLNLMNIPFGTAFSIYTFWALTKDKLKTPKSSD
ncbi:MAG: hypothetical protein NTV80_11410 [Verrucomicrobia bacterium]|nr:hypothetical protein [Verrucomicrobiota bacterium]